MIREVFAATVRHRRMVLILGILAAAGNAAAVAVAPTVGQHLFLPLLAAFLVLAVLTTISWRIRPASFVVQPQIPAFVTPAPAWRVFLALAGLMLFSAKVTLMRSGGHSDSWELDPALHVPWFLIVVLLTVDAWRGHGAQLRPYGVHQGYALGSLRVPWEALPVGHTDRPTDRPATLRLAYAEPQLVRRRGFPLSRHTIRTEDIDAQFLASAIRHYVNHPEYRAAIGTQEEYQRLLAELTDPPGGTQRDDNF